MDVTVSNFPTQINVTSTPIEVTVATAGVAGPPGPAGGTGSSTSNIGITGVSISGGLGFTGNFNILAGTNITLSQSANSLTIIAASTSADISGLISTGNADLRYLQTGASGSFYRSSNPNNFSSSGNVENTGTLLISLINTERNKNTVTAVSVHSGSSLTGIINFIGTGNVTVTTDGNTIRISGNNFSSGSALPFCFGNVNINSGLFNSQFIQFPQNFAETPIVLGNIVNNSGDSIIGFHTSGISRSGFYINLTDYLTTNNYYFQYLATTGLGFYEIATSLLSQGNNSSSSSSSAQALIGSGSPNFIVAAVSGSTYVDWFSRTFYIKCTGTSTDKEGWF